MQYQSIKSTHFHFWSGLANFESKVGAENHFKSSPISNINPSNQHTFIFGVASTIPSPPSTCDETPNTLLLLVIIALIPLNTLLIPDIDTMTPVLAFIILIRPVEFISSHFPQWKSVRRLNSNENTIKDGGSTVPIKRHLLVNNAIPCAFSAQAIK